MEKLNFSLVVFAISFLFFSCHSEKQNSETVYSEDTLPGRVVVEMYSDSSPALVQFFKIDSLGKRTNELTREIQYYEGHKKYIDLSYESKVTDTAVICLKNGPGYAYFKNGRIQTKAFYVDGLENGEYLVYYENGNLLMSANYKMGVRDGKWKFYYENGTICKEGGYNDGICVGEWKEYDISGKLIKSVTADENTIGCGDCPKCRDLLRK